MTIQKILIYIYLSSNIPFSLPCLSFLITLHQAAVQISPFMIYNKSYSFILLINSANTPDYHSKTTRTINRLLLLVIIFFLNPVMLQWSLLLWKQKRACFANGLWNGSVCSQPIKRLINLTQSEGTFPPHWLHFPREHACNGHKLWRRWRMTKICRKYKRYGMLTLYITCAFIHNQLML